MAQTADLRSEGNLSQHPAAIKQRRNYQLAKAAGRCVIPGCGNELRNRSYCYEHSKAQTNATYLTGARFFAKMAGVDLHTGKVTPEAAAALGALLKYK